jgi:hypothetical protein
MFHDVWNIKPIATVLLRPAEKSLDANGAGNDATGAREAADCERLVLFQ